MQLTDGGLFIDPIGDILLDLVRDDLPLVVPRLYLVVFAPAGPPANLDRLQRGVSVAPVPIFLLHVGNRVKLARHNGRGLVGWGEGVISISILSCLSSGDVVVGVCDGLNAV